MLKKSSGRDPLGLVRSHTQKSPSLDYAKLSIKFSHLATQTAPRAPNTHPSSKASPELEELQGSRRLNRAPSGPAIASKTTYST